MDWSRGLPCVGVSKVAARSLRQSSGDIGLPLLGLRDCTRCKLDIFGCKPLQLLGPHFEICLVVSPSAWAECKVREQVAPPTLRDVLMLSSGCHSVTE